ncbi:hypothetical protein A2U01_0003001, partial [Trifolium medium]|nr:hypothetical protein [Trifolium medium]
MRNSLLELAAGGASVQEQILNKVDHLLEDWCAAKNTQKTNNAAEAKTAAVMPESRVQSHGQEQAGVLGRNLKQ